jgi:hypothetical protein
VIDIEKTRPSEANTVKVNTLFSPQKVANTFSDSAIANRSYVIENIKKMVGKGDLATSNSVKVTD